MTANIPRTFIGLKACAYVLSIVVIFDCLNAEPVNSQPNRQNVNIDVTSLCQLVEQMRIVSLKYHYDPDAAPARELHPYAVGFTPSRNTLLFGLQVDGYSKSAESNSAKGWRSFRTDKIKSVVALDSTFTAVRPELPGRKIISAYACRNKLTR
jgi:predicted DNA-binding transcriptional regulator YafY